MGPLNDGIRDMTQSRNPQPTRDLEVVMDLDPAAADVRRVVEGLFDSVEAVLATGRGRQPFSVFVRAAGGALLGGLNARLVFGDLHIDQLWCAPDIRRKGYGTTLLVHAERFGRQHGAEAALLNTFDPDLVGFYERRGYETIGEVPGLAARRPVFFLRKAL
jgi:GNAT superfamily N-acetyltransferase